MRMDDNFEDRQAFILRKLQHIVNFFIVKLLAARHEGKNCRKQFLPSPSAIHTRHVALRIAYMAALVHPAVMYNKLFTKRDIYYMCRPLFQNPAIVDRTLHSLASCVGVNRNDINVVAAPKGIVVGPVSFVDEAGYQVDVALFGREGCLIPPRPERMTSILIDASAIVVYVAYVFLLLY